MAGTIAWFFNGCAIELPMRCKVILRIGERITTQQQPKYGRL